MDKEEVMRLHEELNKLSDFWDQNLERMIEIAKILTDYYKWWGTVKDAEKNFPPNDQKNTV
jgi:hypothetical protein